MDSRRALFAAAAEREGDLDVSAGACRGRTDESASPESLRETMREIVAVQQSLTRMISDLDRRLGSLKPQEVALLYPQSH